MKKWLMMIGAVGLTALPTASVVGCQPANQGIVEPPIKDLSQEELQAQLDAYWNKMLELQDKVDEAEAEIDLKKAEEYFNQFLEQTFMLCFFQARIYLETQYSLKNTMYVAAIDDEETYQYWLNKQILRQVAMKDQLEDIIQEMKEIRLIKIKNFANYFDHLENYLNQLQAKVKA